MSWLTTSRTFVCINISDWIDVALSIMQLTRDRDALDMYISLFPEKITEDHINQFWEEKGIIPGTQWKMQNQIDEFIDVLKENNKYKDDWQ